jgi:hypothetical protein
MLSPLSRKIISDIETSLAIEFEDWLIEVELIEEFDDELLQAESEIRPRIIKIENRYFFI